MTDEKKQHLHALQSTTRQQLDALTLYGKEADVLLKGLKESIEALCGELGIELAQKPGRVQLQSLRKKQIQQEGAAQFIRFDALLSGNINPLAKQGSLSELPGHIKKISALGATVELEAETSLEIMILQAEIKTKLADHDPAALAINQSVTVQIINDKKCEVVVVMSE